MKTFLGKGGVRGNISVFLTADCLEIEEQFSVDIVRRRIYLDDIVMVAHSRRFGWFYLVAAVMGAMLFGLAALATLIAKGELAIVVVLGVVAMLFAGVGALRLISRQDVITIFGRRKTVEIVFGFDKKQIQARFDSIVNAIREKIAAVNARIEREKPPPVAVPEPIAVPDAEPMPEVIPITDAAPPVADPMEPFFSTDPAPQSPADPWAPPRLPDSPATDTATWVKPDEPPQN